MSTVVSWNSRRGRANEFERIAAGEATLNLENSDGRYDVNNASGPYFGQLLPLLQTKINLQHPYTGDYFDLFTGYTEEIQLTRPAKSYGVSRATLPLTDGFELLASAQLNARGGRKRDTALALQKGGSYFGPQHVDSRIHAALSDAGWPFNLRRIATGNVNVLPRTYDFGNGGSPLEICQEAADAEFPGVANFFIDKSGKAAFSGRSIRFVSVSEGSTIVTYPEWVQYYRVGDRAAMENDDTILIPIATDNFSQSYGKQEIFNDITVLAMGMDASDVPGNRLIDGTSRGLYGSRALSYTDLLVLNGFDADFAFSGVEVCQKFAQYYKNNYAVPQQRITAIEFHGAMAVGDDEPDGAGKAIWDFLLGVEINHIVEVNTQNPPYDPDTGGGIGGGLIGERFFVEGISYQCQGNSGYCMASGDAILVPRLVMTLDLSPVANYADETPFTGE